MMTRMWKKYAGNQEGVAYIELAFTLLIMTTILFGLVELTAFMRVKNKVNQVADQLAATLSTIPRWQTEYVDGLLPAAEIMARPFGIAIDGRFCSGTKGEIYNFNRVFDAADCTYGAYTPGSGALAVSDCDDAKLGANNLSQALPGIQYVTLAASCRYRPYLNYLGLFDNVVIVSKSVTPIRYHMAWDF